MKKHAIEKGDGVQADKVRKLLLDVYKLYRDEENPELKEII